MLYSKSYLISCLKLYKSAKYFEIIYLFLIWSLWCKLLQLELAELDQRYILCRSVWAKLRLLWQLKQCLDDLWASVNLVKAAKYSVIVNFFLYFCSISWFDVNVATCELAVARPWCICRLFSLCCAKQSFGNVLLLISLISLW